MTDAELAAKLIALVDDTEPDMSIQQMHDLIRLAAQRLKGEISEAEVEAAFRVLGGHALPNRSMIRAALEAAKAARE